MNGVGGEDATVSWFGVRCIFKHANAGVYEERITIWRARDFSDAISMAENEATEYVEILGDVSYLGLAQGFSLSEVPGHGAEVFSLMRDSALGEDEYLDTFFTTGSEREGEIDEFKDGE